MKSFKQLKEDIANVSASIGVRGFGDVTGTPKVGDENETNPHIDRVIQGAEEHDDEVLQLIKNNTDGIYTWEGGFDWWADRKGVAKYTKTHSAGPLGFRKVKPGDLQENIAGGEGSAANMASSGYIAGTGYPLEGKPSNWAEPGVQPKDQGRKKKKEDDPRMFAMFRRKAVSILGTGLQEIPIQEEEITNTTDAAPGLGDNKEVFPGKTKKNTPVWPLFRRLPLNLQEEVKTGMFAGEQTFIVPSHVFEKTVHAKKKGKHWRTYINDEMFHPAIREFAYKKPKKPIIFEDEKTGYMSYARYGRKKR